MGAVQERKTRWNLVGCTRYKLEELTRSYNKYIMLANPPGNLQIIVTRAMIDARYVKAIQQGLHRYQVKQFKIELLSPEEVFAMHYLISNKFYSPSQQTNDTWWENELRLFIWTLVCYSYLEDRCVSQMTSVDWEFFSEIFNHRSPDIFEFQALSILKRESKFSRWNSEQIKLLDSIIKSKNVKNKWNDIAKNLFLLSEKKYFRTSKQCRQYWINHLDPTPLKSQWNLQQDLELLKAIKVLGKRWSKVSKKLRGRRTQHMVKNRYKSLLQFQQKRLVGQNTKVLSEDQIITVLEKRIRLAIEELKTKPSQLKQELSKTKESEMGKFQSAEDQRAAGQQDPIQELLMQQLQERPQGMVTYEKLFLEYDTIQSIVCQLQSPFQIEFKMNESKMVEDEDFGSFFHKEYYFNQ